MSSLVLTATVHLLMRISIFYEQPKNQCSSAPEIGSWCFIASVFMILLDNDVYPCRYRCIPIPCQVVVETCIALVLTEFATLVLWCNLEKAAFRMLKAVLSEGSSNLYYDMGGDFLVGFLITLLGIFIVCNTAIATGHFEKLQKKYYQGIRGGERMAMKFWSKCPSFRECQRAVEETTSYNTEEDDDGLNPATVILRNRRRRRQR